jgi:hypothetical protein
MFQQTDRYSMEIPQLPLELLQWICSYVTLPSLLVVRLSSKQLAEAAFDAFCAAFIEKLTCRVLKTKGIERVANIISTLHLRNKIREVTLNFRYEDEQPRNPNQQVYYQDVTSGFSDLVSTLGLLDRSRTQVGLEVESQFQRADVITNLLYIAISGRHPITKLHLILQLRWEFSIDFERNNLVDTSLKRLRRLEKLTLSGLNVVHTAQHMGLTDELLRSDSLTKLRRIEISHIRLPEFATLYAVLDHCGQNLESLVLDVLEIKFPYLYFTTAPYETFLGYLQTKLPRLRDLTLAHLALCNRRFSRTVYRREPGCELHGVLLMIKLTNNDGKLHIADAIQQVLDDGLALGNAVKHPPEAS